MYQVGILLVSLFYLSCTLNMIQTSTIGSKDQVSTDPTTDNEPDVDIPLSGLMDVK